MIRPFHIEVLYKPTSKRRGWLVRFITVMREVKVIIRK